MEIKKVSAREIIDSRGNPTVEAEVVLADGSIGVAQVPSGASTGKYEAYELRDKDESRYRKMGVRAAVNSVCEIIEPALLGVDAFDTDEIDHIMIALDGAHNKSILGANAILSVSIATAKAAANSVGLPLYRYLGGALVRKLPVPMMNILNGGKHAANNIDIQEFMILPMGAVSFSEGVRACCEVYHTLRSILAANSLSTSVGDEGGFAPMLSSDEDAIKLIISAIEESGYHPGVDFFLGIDAAASEWRTEKGYTMPKRNAFFTAEQLVDYFVSLADKYPILSIEDGVGEEDYEAWQDLTEKLSSKGRILVGDDLFVTNSERIQTLGRENIANAVLIKPNQIGTLRESADACFAADALGYKKIMSHRSGDTEDTFIADFSVAMGCDFIKTGAPTRAERTAKYNRLMKIEEELFAPIYAAENFKTQE